MLGFLPAQSLCRETHTAPVLFFCNSLYRTQNPRGKREPQLSDAWETEMHASALTIATGNDG